MINFYQGQRAAWRCGPSTYLSTRVTKEFNARRGRRKHRKAIASVYLPRGSGLAPQRAAERRKNEGWRVERREKCLEHAEDGDEGDSGGESARVCEQEKFI